jgi:PIN domain nuclease of toxin-antitoxin system
VTVLLDTHVLLWWVHDDPRLVKRVLTLLEDEEVHVVISVASLWEIALKITAGRFDLKPELLATVLEQVGQARISTLPVQRDHVLRTVDLPKHHVDPFDRLLVAQAQIERIPILTSDPLIRKYAVETIW